MPPPSPTPIYHITHWENLPGILASGGLFSCAALKQHSIRYYDIANEDIQDKRAQTWNSYPAFFGLPRKILMLPQTLLPPQTCFIRGTNANGRSSGRSMFTRLGND